MKSNWTQRGYHSTSLHGTMIGWCQLSRFATTRWRLSTVQTILLASWLIAMIAVDVCDAQEPLESSVIEMDSTQTRTETNLPDSDESSSSRALDGDETQADHDIGSSALSTRSPRQHFRLRVGPTSRASSVFKLVSIKRRAAALQQVARNKTDESGADHQRTKLAKREQASKSNEKLPDDELNLITVATNQTVPDHKIERQIAKATTRKISSATLKKLLSQTLPRLNGTISNLDTGKKHQPQSVETNANKSPNFRFVFIQRASPKVPSTSSTTPIPSSTSLVLASSPATSKPRQTLVASVSRQLGNSLLYSAVNLMGHNFTSGCSPTVSSNLMPSLSSLAAAFAPNGCSGGINQSTLDGPNVLDSNQLGRNETQSDLDIKRLSRPLAATTTRVPIQQFATKMKPAKKSRPSKIYNLPVKFIANGQPNGVTSFHSIRQHFASIKKVQQQMEMGSSESNKARKKLAGGQPHLKGTNSRLIYLPLKYLSNAKPHMLSSIVTGTSKMSHKKSKPATKTGTKSPKSHES